ncbi:MAG: sensor histidine kinase [Lachnospiraceae bacterium]
MKTKTFIITFILFLSVFFTSLTFISLKFLKFQLETSMERAMSEHYLISSSMGKELSNLITRGASKEDVVEYLFSYYSEHYAKQNCYIEIYQDAELLFSSFNSDVSKNLYLESSEQSRTASLTSVNNGEYIIVSGEFPQTNLEYSIQYISDVTSAINQWRSMRSTLMLIGIGFSLFVSVLLSTLLSIIFRPLFQVVTASKEIANGNYEKRINISKGHELVVLADGFNNMADKVQSAIDDLNCEVSQRQQFIDNFSHEIRTPLTSIYGFAEYMQKSVLSEDELINMSGYIMDDSKHILGIADRLLDLAAFKNRNLEKQNFSVALLYESTEKLLYQRLTEKQISLIKECSIDYIYGNKDLLQSLLINITNNAIDASEYGSEIKWQAYKDADSKVLSVSDKGEGISPREIDKINQPFYRVDKSRNRGDSGNVGLGLAICQQIAESHNAKIEFHSQLNKGTTVKIRFTTL